MRSRRVRLVEERRRGGKASHVAGALLVAGAAWAGVSGHAPAAGPAPAAQAAAAPAPARHASGGYINPLAGYRWTLDRDDQGMDLLPGWAPPGFRGRPGDWPSPPLPVKMIGAGAVIYSSTASGWPGGAFIAYRLASGRAKGAVIFVAEHLTGLRQADPRRLYPAGTVIATAWPRYPWTEWGWASCDGSGPVVPYGGAPDGTAMPGGLAFERFMASLGALGRADANAARPGRGPDVIRPRC